MGNGPSDSWRQAAGRKGARKRWGDPGVVRLDELTPPQRRLVLALVDAAKAETQKATEAEDQHPASAA